LTAGRARLKHGIDQSAWSSAFPAHRGGMDFIAARPYSCASPQPRTITTTEENTVNIGICLPYSEPGISRRTLLEWCQAIESGPFDAISCGERISGADAVDMRVLLAGAAALTERVRIVPTLYVLPMHDAVRAAKEIASLDLVADGRVDVVVGTGGRPKDYRAVGADFATRNARLPQQVAQMRAIWNGELPFEGSEPIGPQPVNGHKPRILGGFAGPKAIASSAQWADGLYAFSISGDVDEIREKFAVFDRAWAAAGRQGKPWKIGGFWYSLADAAEATLRHYAYEYLRIAGHGVAQAVADSMVQFTPERILQTMRGMQEVGMDELYMVPGSHHVCEVDRLAPLVRQLRQSAQHSEAG
jgi:alkanesulfonate monooxygenase SsuD/methylene tetrahydromethanopterin reductase-like flavin-dependent oxidoreductase (luciferase family)